MSRLDAPALIHGYVNNHSAVRHVLEHVSRHQPWSSRSGHEHRSNDQIGAGNRVVNHVSTRSESGNLRKKNIVEFAQAFEIVVNDSDVRTNTHRDLRGICPDYTAADNYNSV